MLSQVVINQGNFALQNRAEYVVQTVVHCFSITPINKLKINKITPLSQSPLGSPRVTITATLFSCLLPQLLAAASGATTRLDYSDSRNLCLKCIVNVMLLN